MITYGKNGEMWERFCTWENFDIAQKRSRLHKSTKPYIIEYEKERDKNLERDRQLGVSGEYTICRDDYTSRIIYEPKRREIFILNYSPHRIMHHAVINVLMPYYMRMFDYDSYSCIQGRGQTSASKRTMKYVHRYKWCGENDVYHCFPSINLDILSRMHHEKFRDEKFLELNDRIIYSMKDCDGNLVTAYDKNWDEFECYDSSNCPIGNYTSQWYMNFYLNELDWFCQHTLHIPHIRFCDNINVYSNDLDEVKRAQDAIQEFLYKRLRMTMSKSNIRPCADGIDFVGYRHFPDGKLLVRKSTVKRQRKMLELLPEMYEAGLITAETMRSKIDSVTGWWSHAQTYHLIKKTGVMEMRNKYCVEMIKPKPFIADESEVLRECA